MCQTHQAIEYFETTLVTHRFLLLTYSTPNDMKYEAKNIYFYLNDQMKT